VGSSHPKYCIKSSLSKLVQHEKLELVQLKEMEACPARRDGGFRWVLLTQVLHRSPPFPREDLGGFFSPQVLHKILPFQASPT